MKIAKNATKIIATLIIVINIVFSLSVLPNMVYAEGQIYELPSAKSTDSDGEFTRIGGMFLTVAQIIGTSIAVIMLVVLGTKYIISSPNDRATLKQHAVVYITGAIILFAASSLLGIVKNFATSMPGGTATEETEPKTEETQPEGQLPEYQILGLDGQYTPPILNK